MSKQSGISAQLAMSGRYGTRGPEGRSYLLERRWAGFGGDDRRADGATQLADLSLQGV